MSNILFETRTGSHLYGTTTPESDIDIKRIILPDLDSLLLGNAPKNVVIRRDNKLGEKNGPDDIDIEEIPIQVFAQDFLSGQTYALELAWAVKYNQAGQVVYNSSFYNFCHFLRKDFLTSNILAMVGFADNQAKLYSNKGKRLNVAIAVFELLSAFPEEDKILKHELAFNYWAQKLEDKYPLYFELNEYAITADKQTLKPCTILLGKTLPYTCTFKEVKKIVQVQIDKFGSRAGKAALSTADWKATAHAIRICGEGIDILSGKDLIFPLSLQYSNYLKDVIAGKFDIQDIRVLIEKEVDKLKQLSLESKLPVYNPEMKIKLNNWLLPWLKTFYGLK